jgi:hypothetical protein
VLADAVGLGKTYVALATATRYSSAAAVVPAAIAAQWRRVMRATGVCLPVVTHEALSRGAIVPAADLLLVDEAHRFRNPEARRYGELARAVTGSDVLLITATPVVNQVVDLASLVRLFLPDQGLALFGVRSLRAAITSDSLEQLAHALSTLVVARSPDALRDALQSMPRLHSARVLNAPPVPQSVLEPLYRGLCALRFPTLADRQAAELLRLHLTYRLASSVPAFLETLRRHAVYLRRALAAGRRGERLSRSAARVLFGSDEDLQLELDGLRSRKEKRIDVSALGEEVHRVAELQELARSCGAVDPKAAALLNVLDARGGSKVLVFTAATATAHHLAHCLGWKKVCVATGRGARIASGTISLEEALGLFAPIAHDRKAPPPVLAVDTLIATDLASEGLNLQDADAVVHYDLPWTPLRLEQRTGRAARLGSPHEQVAVYWFRPTPLLERHLALARRLRHKLEGQLRLGAATSSDLGRARVLGGLFDWREAHGAPSFGAHDGPHYAVVRGPPVALCALRWTLGSVVVPQLVAVAGTPATVVANERTAGAIMQCLAQAPASSAALRPGMLDALLSSVRDRLADHARGPTDDDTRCLARRILRLGGRAARDRDTARLRMLDYALDRLVAGLAAGPLRSLEHVVGSHHLTKDLERWLQTLRPDVSHTASVTLDFVLAGDGTLTGTP